MNNEPLHLKENEMIVELTIHLLRDPHVSFLKRLAVFWGEGETEEGLDGPEGQFVQYLSDEMLEEKARAITHELIRFFEKTSRLLPEVEEWEKKPVLYCSDWEDFLRRAGFDVSVEPIKDPLRGLVKNEG